VKGEHSTNKSQPDLNLTILSHLATRDLTRATRVSKQWQSSILNFAEPRRTLFLEPAPASGEYLDWLKDRDKRCCEDLRMWQPAIVREPSFRGKPIVEPHPIIANGVCPIHKIRIHIDLPSYDRLEAVPAATFLFQPPREHITFGYWKYRNSLTQPDFPLQRKGGVTFGALVEKLDNIRVWSESQVPFHVRRSRRLEGVRQKRERRMREKKEREEHEQFLYATKHLGIQAEGVVASNGREVQIARRAIKRARLFSLYDKLKAYKDQPFFAFIVGERLV
jgi:hypothetical protein